MISVDEAKEALKEARAAEKRKARGPLSKLIMKVAFFKEWFIILFACGFCVWTRDGTPLAYLIPAVFIEIGVEKAYYFKSSSAEKLKNMEMNYDCNYDENNFRG